MSSLLTPDLKNLVALDQELVEAAKGIRVLGSIGWPVRVAEEFLTGWRRGDPSLPEVTYSKPDFSAERARLKSIIKRADHSHPVGRYISQTAASYLIAAKMLESTGTPEFGTLSGMLYGTPVERLGSLSHLQMAEDVIRITDDFAAADSATHEPDPEHCVRPEAVAAEIQGRANAMFTAHKIQVVIDPNLTAKAAAGSVRVRIRGMTSFTHTEVRQLLEHELFVHSATTINGREQVYLKSFGLGSPRTTATQEGLATFAELITASMDLSRLRRIALRIKAIHHASEGADFIETFRYFLGAGQSLAESFQSAARVFRGGDVRGRHVFTKDIVYLKGLARVHTFLRKAIEMRKIEFPGWLFTGRLALGDIICMEEFFRGGFIRPALYMPDWVRNRDALAAYLSYSAFMNRLRLAEVSMADFIEDPLESGIDELEAMELSR